MRKIILIVSISMIFAFTVYAGNMGFFGFFKGDQVSGPSGDKILLNDADPIIYSTGNYFNIN